LPLLLVYESLMLLTRSEVRNGADVLTKIFLGALGVRGVFGITLIICIAFAFIIWRDGRKKKTTPVKPVYFAIMFLESCVYATLVAPIIYRLMKPLSGVAFDSFPLHEQLTLSLGAGIYEEFVFRLLMIAAIVAIFRRLALSRIGWAYFWAIVFSSIVFSLFHYIGGYGDKFTLLSFIFRFFAGVLFAILYVLRGYGIAVYTHAMYDIYVTLSLI
jgi:hypothetical protein